MARSGAPNSSCGHGAIPSDCEAVATAEPGPDASPSGRADEGAPQSERLALHSEALPVGLMITDGSDSMIITAWNRRAEQIFGYTRAEAIGQSACTLIAADNTRDFMRDAAKRSVRPGGEGAAGVRTQNRTKDGREIWCEWFDAALRNEAGDVTGVVGMVQDITARLHAEERTRLWTSVLRQSSEGIMICDAQSRIVLVNGAFEQLTGYKADDVLGKTPNILHSGRHDRSFYAAMWQALVRDGEWRGEIWNQRANGEVYVEWLSISTVRNELGVVTHYIGIFSDITLRKQTEERVAHLAHFDPLTDLPNRALLIERVAELLSQARRAHDKLALLFIDLDRFKDVNDSMGHVTGDELLKHVAERLRNAVRSSDLVARMGGDEFVVALPNIASKEEPAVVAQKLLAVLRQPLTLCEQELSLSASIGICLFPDDARDVGELIRNADAAMYDAKSSGRCTFSFYTREMNARALQILSTENALRDALAREEFVLHYQPQIELHSGALVGAEALIRWQRPGHGLVMPGAFIPVAEERGSIAAIDTWVLGEACRQVARWANEGVLVPRIAVNLSASAFHQLGFVERVERVLREHAVPARCIELELTERIAMRDSDATVKILQRLRETGVWLSIDDFGTGYSSLQYLRRFPIQQIKIDQSFVREMLVDPGAAGIVRGIIALGKSLSLEVLAEGVETAEQLAQLRADGCDKAQGFLMSRGVAAQPYADLVRGWRAASFGP